MATMGEYLTRPGKPEQCRLGPELLRPDLVLELCTTNPAIRPIASVPILHLQQLNLLPAS